MAALKLLWFAPLPTVLVAQALDLQGVCDVQAERTHSSDQQFEQLCNGAIDAAVTAIDNVVTWNARAPDARFRAVAQVERTTELMLVARPGIRSIVDLVDRTLLVDSPTNGFVVALRAMLIEAGIDQTQYRLEPSGGVTERLDALLAGRGDATLLGPPFHNAAIAQGCNIVGRVQNSWPEFPGQGLVIDTFRLSASRHDSLLPSLIKLLRAMELARQFILSKPNEALDILGRFGIPAGAASGMLAALPSTILPDAAGIDCLIRHRATVWPEAARLLRADLIDENALVAMQAAHEKG